MPSPSTTAAAATTASNLLAVKCLSAIYFMSFTWLARTWWQGYTRVRAAETEADAEIYATQVELSIKRAELGERGHGIHCVIPEPGFFRMRRGVMLKAADAVVEGVVRGVEKMRLGAIRALGGMVA